MVQFGFFFSAFLATILIVLIPFLGQGQIHYENLPIFIIFNVFFLWFIRAATKQKQNKELKNFSLFLGHLNT